ncbi:MAG: ModD protein [Raoultibacter sp.]
MYISNPLLDSLILEDAPYGDLTSSVLGISDQPGEIEYFTREDCLLSGVEEAIQMCKKIGLSITEHRKSGDSLAAGESFLCARGSAQCIHTAWKVCLNMCDYYSAVATKTNRMVRAAQAENPHVAVLTTRKGIPSTKPFATKAARVGGAFPHRLGLSETILIFDHHLAFIGGIDALIEKLPEIKAHCCEKKIIIEASLADAPRLAQAGIDGIQFDKVPAADLSEMVPRLRGINPAITLLAAGGVNEGNAASYAQTGVNGLVTSCLFFVKPIDMSVRIKALSS